MRLVPCARRLAAAVLALVFAVTAAAASQLCPDEQATEQLPPANPAYCARLDPIMRKPSALPLDQYEAALNDFIGNYCHRRLASGWKMDKTVRDAGPFVAGLNNGTWSGTEQGTHMPVLIWYSPEMVAWLKKYRPAEGTPPARVPPVPDGAIMIKEMYNSTPAAACRVPDLLKLKPVEQGAAVMVRDSAAAKDGWFWGWYGWPNINSGWSVDYPPSPANGLPFMGFGQYCLNCHASARDNQTFASLGNIKGEAGTFLSFLAQDFYQTQTFGIQPPPKALMMEAPIFSEHLRILEARRLVAPRALLALPPSNSDFMVALNLGGLPPVTEPVDALYMQSQTYDNVWNTGQGPAQAHTFLTSDQCVGCHSAGGTGLQYEMTAPVPGPVPPKSPTLINFSPYGTWRTSPMGLAGRDRSSSPNSPVRRRPFTPRPRQPYRAFAWAATASRDSASSALTPRSLARRARISCVAWSTRSPTPPATHRPPWPISAASPATASPATPATTWSSARLTPPNLKNSRRTAASPNASRC
jgi:hypothetical protein